MPDPLIEILGGIVGERHVITDEDVLASYETDWTGRYSGRARLVVRPSSADQTAAVLAACTAARVSVIPQGGNTGLVGGGVPRNGEVVLTTRALNSLTPGDPTTLLAGAGATLAAVQRQAARNGLRFPLDLAARDSATVGGMVATNARGAFAMRYGAMGDQVSGVEAVTASGQVLHDLGGDSGLATDLAGSEGALAVITRVGLRLVAVPGRRVTALLGFGSSAAAVAAARAVGSVEAVEIMYRSGLSLVFDHAGFGSPLAGDYPVYLLVEAAADADPLGELTAALESCEESAIAEDGPGRQRLWRLREAHTESINAAGIPHKLDVRLAVDELTAAEEALHLIARDHSARLILYGHLGDGDFHINLLGPAPGDRAVDLAVLKAIAELGGSVVGEHGAGVAKTELLPLSEPATRLEALAAVKLRFDPSGVLNPGVLVGTWADR